MVTSDYVLDGTFTVLMSRKVELDNIVLFNKTLENNMQAGALRLVSVDDESPRVYRRHGSLSTSLSS